MVAALQQVSQPAPSLGSHMAAQIPQRKAPQDQRITDEFVGWVKQETAEFEQTANPGRLLQYRTWLKVDYYARGNQLIFWDAMSESYLPLPSEDTDLHHTVNYFASVLDTLVTEYTKSQPRLVAYSRAGDDQRIKDSVEASQYVIECLRPTLWTKRQVQREAHLVLLRGGLFTRTYEDKTAGAPVQVAEHRLDTQTLEPGQFWCPHCGAQGTLGTGDSPVPAQPGGAFPAAPKVCPQCGKGPIDVQAEPVMANTLQQADSYKVPAGEIRSEPIDPFEVDIADRSTGPWDSPTLRWDTAEYNASLCMEFPDWRPDKAPASVSGVSAEKTIGLQYARSLELHLQNSGAADQSRTAYANRMSSASMPLIDKKTSIRSQVHFRTGVYAHKTFDVNVYLPGRNQAIPAGTELGTVFPNGLKIILINGECVKVEDFNLDWEWHGYTVTVPTRGFFGNGAEQFVAIQDWINDSVSLAITMGMMTASGITIVDKDRIEGVFGKPGETLSLLDRGLGEPIGNSIEHIAIAGDHGQVQQLLAMSKSDLVAVSGARSPDWGGAPDQAPGKQLATGINYNNAIASAVAGMKLELRAENFAMRMEQALRIFGTSTVYPRYLETDDGQKGRWMRGYEVGHDIKVKFEEDSAQPLTTLERRANLVAAMSQVGYGKIGPEGKPINPPWLERSIAKQFNLPEDPEASNEWSTIAYRRIDAMKEAYQMASQFAQGMPPDQAEQFVTAQILRAGLEREEFDITDEMALTPSKLDKDSSLIEEYLRFGATDEFQECPLPVKQAIEKLVPIHFAAQKRDEGEMLAITQKIMGPLQPPPTPEPKAPSISIKFGELPDEAKFQVLKEAGITIDPRAFEHKAMQDQQQAAIENAPPPGEEPEGGEPQAPGKGSS